MTASEATILLRAEERGTERRAPITPKGAAALREQGIDVVVECSPRRVFSDDAYEAVGCPMVPAGAWLDAPSDVVVVGIKELPEEPAALRHRHVYFGHAYKGQEGAEQLLGRFVAGGGTLLDLEYLVDERGRRVVAFGYWAGFVGASLGALHAAGRLPVPVQPMSLADLATDLEEVAERLAGCTAVVTGAWGRAGRGAVDALILAGISVSRWDRADTAKLDSAALIAHDILVHCVLATGRQQPWLTQADRARAGRRLRVLVDVTADVTSDLNLLPVSDRHTSWTEPVRQLWDDEPPLEAIVIDNLPSLLPKQASEDFSSALVPLLPGLFTGEPVWTRAERRYAEAIAGLQPGSAPAVNGVPPA